MKVRTSFIYLTWGKKAQNIIWGVGGGNKIWGNNTNLAIFSLPTHPKHIDEILRFWEVWHSERVQTLFISRTQMFLSIDLMYNS